MGLVNPVSEAQASIAAAMSRTDITEGELVGFIMGVCSILSRLYLADHPNAPRLLVHEMVVDTLIPDGLMERCANFLIAQRHVPLNTLRYLVTGTGDAMA